MAKVRRPKASDIPDTLMLLIVGRVNLEGRWAHDGDLNQAFWVYPPKVVAAKIKRLCKRGYVDGCWCGCRGDWTLTDLGRTALALAPPRTYKFTVAR